MGINIWIYVGHFLVGLWKERVEPECKNAVTIVRKTHRKLPKPEMIFSPAVGTVSEELISQISLRRAWAQL